MTRAWDDNIFSESAAAAFWQTLSLPPLLLGLFGVLSYVGDLYGPDTVTAVQDQVVDLVGTVFSREAVQDIIAPTVADILTTARAEVVSIGFVISLWSGSSAMSSFVDAITRAHEQYLLRNPVWQRLLAVLLYAVGLVTGVVALPIVAIGPERPARLLPEAWQSTARPVIDLILSPPVIGLVLVLALATLYKIALPLKPPWWRGLPGAVLAAVVFLAGATGLRLYLDWLTGTGYTYGALAAPIAFLLGTFFIGMAIVLGAHFNASIQALWPVPLQRPAQPAGAGVGEDGRGRGEPVGVGGGDDGDRCGAGRGDGRSGADPRRAADPGRHGAGAGRARAARRGGGGAGADALRRRGPEARDGEPARRAGRGRATAVRPAGTAGRRPTTGAPRPSRWWGTAADRSVRSA